MDRTKEARLCSLFLSASYKRNTVFKANENILGGVKVKKRS